MLCTYVLYTCVSPWHSFNCCLCTPLSFYRYYFQLLVNELLTTRGFLGIIRRFGWKKVGIITQNERLFTVVSGARRKGQEKGGINHSQQDRCRKGRDTEG